MIFLLLSGWKILRFLSAALMSFKIFFLLTNFALFLSNWLTGILIFFTRTGDKIYDFFPMWVWGNWGQPENKKSSKKNLRKKTKSEKYCLKEANAKDHQICNPLRGMYFLPWIGLLRIWCGICALITKCMCKNMLHEQKNRNWI